MFQKKQKKFHSFESAIKKQRKEKKKSCITICANRVNTNRYRFLSNMRNEGRGKRIIYITEEEVGFYN